MPTKSQALLPSSAAPDIAAAQPKPNSDPPKIARQIFANVKERLENEMNKFLERSTIEEQRLMIEVLNSWDNNSGLDRPRSPGEYEIPLYTAIQQQWDSSCHIVAVPDSDMVPKVEEFIAALERRSWKKRAAILKPMTREEEDQRIRDRFETSFRSEIELFARDAGRPSLAFMRDILARWNELARDPDLNILPNTLAIAVEIELDKLRAEAAAEAAKKDA